MANKRKLKRRHLIYYLKVYNGKSKTPLGFLVDIHSSGIMLLSEKEIPANKVYKLKMELPETLGKKAHINFEAKSIWCKQGINSDFYETGFEFNKISKVDSDSIDNVISFFGFDD